MKNAAVKSTSLTKGEESMDENSYRICRTCLISKHSACLVSLFHHWAPPWKLMGTPCDDIANQLSRLADVKIEENDGYPQEICTECFDRFKDAFTFYYSVRHHDNKMRRNQLLLSTPNMSYSKLEVPDETNELENIIKQEVLSDEEVHTMTDCGAECQADIKIEPEELVKQSLPSFFVDSKSDFSQGNIVISSSFSVNKNDEEEQPDLNHDEDDQFPWIKEELESDLDSDVPLECLLCNKEFNTVSGLKAHVIGSHSYNNVYRKITNGPRRSRGEKCSLGKCLECGAGTAKRNIFGNTENPACEECADKILSDINEIKSSQAMTKKTMTVRQLVSEYASTSEYSTPKIKYNPEKREFPQSKEFNGTVYLKTKRESSKDTSLTPDIEKANKVNRDIENKVTPTDPDCIEMQSKSEKEYKNLPDVIGFTNNNETKRKCIPEIGDYSEILGNSIKNEKSHGDSMNLGIYQEKIHMQENTGMEETRNLLHDDEAIYKKIHNTEKTKSKENVSMSLLDSDIEMNFQYKEVSNVNIIKEEVTDLENVDTQLNDSTQMSTSKTPIRNEISCKDFGLDMENRIETAGLKTPDSKFKSAFEISKDLNIGLLRPQIQVNADLKTIEIKLETKDSEQSVTNWNENTVLMQQNKIGDTTQLIRNIEQNGRFDKDAPF